jgi:mono/diheme cytochrome c family protein
MMRFVFPAATLFLTASATAAPDFKKDILPLLDSYCISCHDEGDAKGGIDIAALTEVGAFWKQPKTWEKVLNAVRDASMPPSKKTQPKPEERALLSEWLTKTLDNPDASKVPSDVGRKLIHRLSRLEYNNTVRDLLGVDTKPADNFPPDSGGGGGFDNNASTLFIPPVLLEKMLSVTADIVAAAKPDRIFRIRPGAGKDDRIAAKENLEFLGARAFRRPLSPEETTGFLAIYDAERKAGRSWEDGVRQSVRGLLISPSFIYRAEQDRPGNGPQPISDWELAARLSYFLWSSMPDDTTLALAQSGKLREPATLQREVVRMLADSKSRAFSENFTSQWLRTKELSGVRPAADKFPEFSPALRDAMMAEPVEFFHALVRENRPLHECIDADYTFANAELAKFYGLAGVTAGGFQKVKLPDRSRGGVITMAGVLTLTSYPRRSSPVLRGRWLMEEILGTPPPPAPPMIKALPTSDKPRNGLTFRQQLEQHRNRPECSSCHKTMDQLGFGLENFNPIGQWREKINDAPVDNRGELPSGQKFTGPAELKALLAPRRDEFTRNIAERMMSYALGRGIEQTDWLTIRQLSKSVANRGYKTQDLVIGIVQSPQFLMRRPAEISKQ